jgi:hypothetical protein
MIHHRSRNYDRLLSLAANSNGSGGDDDDESVFSRLKSLLKMPFRKSSSSRSINTPNGSADNEDMSLLQQVKSYVKYPYTYLKHYFAGEKQEEVDGFNDIIVSDETVDDSATVLELPVIESATAVANGPSGFDVVEEDIQLQESTSNVATTIKGEIPGDRWAVSARNVDLSGRWNIITTDEFQKDYDKYLRLLGQPFIVRSVALSIVGMTTEETVQSDQGRALLVRGTNARGVWERTLTASGTDEKDSAFTPVRTPILTIDKERVEAEAWWENKGTVHHSWLRGVTKYGGGDFESKRYLEGDGKIFVCESTFHPKDETREKATITWRFLRQGETLA